MDGPYYLDVPPVLELRDRVESVWLQEHPPAPFAAPTTVLPTARVELVLSYGDPFVRVGACGETPIPQASIVAPRTKPLVVRATGRTGLVIVGFHPWAAGALTGMGPPGATDDVLEIAAVWGDRAARRLRESVEGAAAPRERIRRVQASLVRLLDGWDADPLAIAAAERINRSWGRTPVRRLAGELGVCRRHLQRRVVAAAGLGPKKLSSVVRFQKMLACLRAGIPDAVVVHRCGYVDQSHLIHELRTFASTTPTALRTRPDRPLDRSFNHADVTRFYSTVYLAPPAPGDAGAPAPRSARRV